MHRVNCICAFFWGKKIVHCWTIYVAMVFTTGRVKWSGKLSYNFSNHNAKLTFNRHWVPMNVQTQSNALDLKSTENRRKKNFSTKAYFQLLWIGISNRSFECVLWLKPNWYLATIITFWISMRSFLQTVTLWQKKLFIV